MTQKNDIRIDLSTDAVIKALEHYCDGDPKKYISKHRLFPMVIRRVENVLENDNLPIYDELAIPPPDEKYLHRKWAKICLHAADYYHKYIDWGIGGVRLCGFDDYQKISGDKLVPICEGIKDNVARRGRVIINQGGQTIQITIGVRLLESGEEQDGDDED